MFLYILYILYTIYIIFYMITMYIYIYILYPLLIHLRSKQRPVLGIFTTKHVVPPLAQVAGTGALYNASGCNPKLPNTSGCSRCAFRYSCVSDHEFVPLQRHEFVSVARLIEPMVQSIQCKIYRIYNTYIYIYIYIYNTKYTKYMKNIT